jgi:hypothetical protein
MPILLELESAFDIHPAADGADDCAFSVFGAELILNSNRVEHTESTTPELISHNSKSIQPSYFSEKYLTFRRPLFNRFFMFGREKKLFFYNTLYKLNNKMMERAQKAKTPFYPSTTPAAWRIP